MNTTVVDIFLGLDVGKTDHWGCVLRADGTKVWNKTLPNAEAKLNRPGFRREPCYAAAGSLLSRGSS